MIASIKHKPRLGDHCYGNRYFVVDKTIKDFEIRYEKGWESVSQISLCFGFGRIIIKLGFKLPLIPIETGVYTHMASSLFLRWNDKYIIWHIPYLFWQHQSTERYCNDGTWKNDKLTDWDTRQTMLKKYRLYYKNETKSGELQEATATVHQVRRIWYRKWFPFLKRSRIDIEIDFDSELGSDKGSWKGGVLGTSFEMRSEETVHETWNRFFQEKRFK